VNDDRAPGQRNLAAVGVTAKQELGAAALHEGQAFGRMRDRDVDRCVTGGEGPPTVRAPGPGLVDADDRESIVRRRQPLCVVDQHAAAGALERAFDDLVMRPEVVVADKLAGDEGQ